MYSRSRRAPIVLPEEARTQVLREMRLMLAALNGVLTASVGMDRDRMAEAALSGGTRIAVDRDPAIVQRLPEAFVQLGSSVHRDFDALADRPAAYGTEKVTSMSLASGSGTSAIQA